MALQAAAPGITHIRLMTSLATIITPFAIVHEHEWEPRPTMVHQPADSVCLLLGVWPSHKASKASRPPSVQLAALTTQHVVCTLCTNRTRSCKTPQALPLDYYTRLSHNNQTHACMAKKMAQHTNRQLQACCCPCSFRRPRHRIPLNQPMWERLLHAMAPAH